MKELLTVALVAYGETLKKFPDYPEKRREEYEQLVYDFKTEVESSDPDSRLVYVYYNKLLCFFQDFKSS